MNAARWRRLVALAMPAGALLSGCLAGFQGSLDLLLGRNALENALRLPYSAAWSFVRLFTGLG